jgi:hypothetical protein
MPAPSTTRKIADTRRLDRRLAALLACLVMLAAVMPHVAALALPQPRPQAEAMVAMEHAAAPCHDAGDEADRPAPDCCTMRGCTLLLPVPHLSADAPVRFWHPVAMPAAPSPAGIVVEPGDRPPRA